MKRNPLGSRVPSIVLLLVGAVMAMLGAPARWVRQEQGRPVGCLTAQQVLNLSESICQAVIARSAPLTLTAEERDCQFHCWDVVCSDAGGLDLCDLTWNSDTGELIEVGVNYSMQSGPLLSSARAIVLGRLRLRDLQSSPAPEPWRLLHAPVCAANHLWSLTYAAKGRRAFIELEAHTGALVHVYFSAPHKRVSPHRP